MEKPKAAPDSELSLADTAPRSLASDDSIPSGTTPPRRLTRDQRMAGVWPVYQGPVTSPRPQRGPVTHIVVTVLLLTAFLLITLIKYY